MATLKPHSNKGHDLGDSSTKWGTVHSGDLQTETLTASGNVEIQGNLTVTGSQIVATVDTVEAKDPLISLAKDNTADTFDIGFYGKSVDGSSNTKYHGIVRDADDSGKFKVFKDASGEPGTTVGTHSVATLVADLEVPNGSSLKVPNSAGTLVDYLTAVNLGTAAASKVLVLDSNKDISGIATLTAQTLSAGNITLNGSNISVSGGSPAFSSIDVNGGEIDGTPIGENAQSTAKFTTLNASGATTLDGSVTLGNAAADNITVTGSLASSVIPNLDSTYDLGSNSIRMRHVYSDQVTASTISGFTAGGNINFNNVDMTNVDIDSGTIDGATIATSNITVGAGKTLDVSAGTLSTSAAQKLAILQGAASDVDVGAFDLRAKTLTADDLTDTRVVFAGTDGVLSDNANLTFATDTLTVTKIGAFEAAGAINFANQAMTNVDINSGAIDGATIATSNITVGSGKTLDVSAGTITFAAGQIANASLVNDSVSFGGVSLDLGQSDATPAFNLSDATNYPTSSLVGTITNAQLAGSIDDSKLNTITASNKVSGSAVQLNSIHSAIEDSTGLRLKSALAGDGLALTNQVLSVNVDDSSIETDSDTLRVKAAGVTNDMLAGSIANVKLANSAVTITAGSGLQTGGSVSLGSSVTVDAKVDDSSIEVDSISNNLQVKAAGITNAMLAGSIANAKLSNSSVSFGGVSLALGAADATPAFDLSDATNYPTSSLVGTITNAQLAGSIANDKLANSTVSGVALGSNLNDLTVDDSSIKLSSGTTYNGSAGLTISVKDGGITNDMLAGSITNAKLTNTTVSFGGVEVALGASDATPAFDLTDATNYPTSSLSGTITNTQLAGSIANDKLATSGQIQFAADTGTNHNIALGETFTLAGGEGIDTSISDNTITVAAELASVSNKGVASFHSDDFDVSSGIVTIKTAAILNAQLDGEIADSKLNQITTADKVALSALAISSETSEVTALADSDLFIVKDADGSNGKVAASKLKSYAQAAISVTDAGGDGSLAYNSSTGVITYTGPSASEVRAHVSGGTGVTITDGQIAIGQAVGISNNVQFNQVTFGASTAIDATDAAKIDGITDGTAAANKALVVDSNKDIASIRNLTADQLSDGTATLTNGSLTATSVITSTVYPSTGDLTLTATGSNKVTIAQDLNCEGKIIGGDSGVEFQGSMTFDTDDHVIVTTSNKTLPSPTAGREMIYINNSDSQITLTVSNTALHDIYSGGSASDSIDIAARSTSRLIAASSSLWYVV